MGQERTRSFVDDKPQQDIDWLDRHAPFDLLSRVASLYYLEDKSQIDIAKELSLSRQKVQRLLKQARDQRIVEIHVHSVPVYHMEMERKLKEHFGLQDVVVAPSHPDENHRRYSVARAAAAYLERHLKDGCVITVGLGRNTSETANFFRPVRQYDCTFVSAMGGSPYLGASINPNEISLKFASRAGCKAEILYAPVYVESRRLRDMLVEQETIKQTITLARNADIALLGVGTPTDDSILVQAGCLSLTEAQRLRDLGVVGEVLGNHFNEKGQSVHSDLDRRGITLSLADLRNIPLVIAVASEAEKSKAILGALRTKAIKTLIIECQLAMDILRLAGVKDLKEEDSLLGL